MLSEAWERLGEAVGQAADEYQGGTRGGMLCLEPVVVAAQCLGPVTRRGARC